jgi:hypothetical protein
MPPAAALPAVGNPRASGVDVAQFDRAFEVVDTLVLEERLGITTLYPQLQSDPRGGYLVTDFQEDQVRRYSADGSLLDVFGAGTGRAESIRGPAGAARLPNGDIAVSNYASGIITVVPREAGRPVRQVRTPLWTLWGIHILTGDLLLVEGRDTPYARNLLHVWSLPEGRIVKSYFPPPRQLDSNVVLAMGNVAISLGGDRIAAVHHLSDTLFVFDWEGALQSQARVPVPGWRVPSGPLPDLATPAERQAWSDQFTLISSVWWVGDDVMVQWASGSRATRTYGLLQMSPTGRLAWALWRTPRLLGLHDGQWLFQDPRDETPNRLVVAVRRESQQ